MKLYTQEQVLQMLEVCRDSDLYEHILTFEDILKTETPIELPSDEEIKDASIKYYVNKSACFYFEIGAKWMRDKIKLGNK